MSGVRVLGMPIEYYYPAFSIFMLLLIIVFIPKNKFKSLFWLGLIWGFLGSMIVGTIFGKILNMFQWKYAMPFVFLGHPTWVNFAWMLSIIFFLYYLPTQKEWYFIATYVIGFAVASTTLDVIFHQLGLLQYIHWNPVYRFFVASAWFYGAAKHHRYLLEKGKLES